MSSKDPTPTECYKIMTLNVNSSNMKNLLKLITENDIDVSLLVDVPNGLFSDNNIKMMAKKGYNMHDNTFENEKAGAAIIYKQKLSNFTKIDLSTPPKPKTPAAPANPETTTPDAPGSSKPSTDKLTTPKKGPGRPRKGEEKTLSYDMMQMIAAKLDSLCFVALYSKPKSGPKVFPWVAEHITEEVVAKHITKEVPINGLILAGDLNCTMEDKEEDEIWAEPGRERRAGGKELTEMVNSLDLVDIYPRMHPSKVQYTRNQNATYARLDQIYVHKSLSYHIHSRRTIPTFSDHRAVICEIKVPTQTVSLKCCGCDANIEETERRSSQCAVCFGWAHSGATDKGKNCCEKLYYSIICSECSKPPETLTSLKQLHDFCPPCGMRIPKEDKKTEVDLKVMCSSYCKREFHKSCVRGVHSTTWKKWICCRDDCLPHN